MRVWGLALIALMALFVLLAIAARSSPEVRSTVRGLLEAVGVLEPWQETSRYRALVDAHRTANNELERDCLLIVGDSLTEGFPRSMTVPRGWVNRGISGDRVRHVRARLGPSVLSSPCASVAVLAGTNDLYRESRPAKAIADDLVDLSEELRGAGRTVLLHTLPPMKHPTVDDEAVEQVNSHLAEYARRFLGVYLVDLHGALTEEDRPLPEVLEEDGVHLTRKGYEAWRDALQETVARMRATPETD